MHWFFYALLTALGESVKDVAGKRLAVDPPVIAWAYSAFASPFLLALLFIIEIPPLAQGFWWILVVAALLNAWAVYLYFSAIKKGDLSLTVPLLTLSPLFLLLTSPAMLGEFPSLLGLFGVVAMVAGSWLANRLDSPGRWWEPLVAPLRGPGPRRMLAVVVIWSITSNIDKIGILRSSSVFWALTVIPSMALLLTPLVLTRVRVAQVVRHGKWFLLLGLVNGVAVLAHMEAVTLTLVAYTIAVKRLSVLLSVFLGVWLLREGRLAGRLGGAAVMFLGMLLIAGG